jgi:hypothetical protein
VREINRSFMCIDSVTVYLKELDLLGDDRASSRVTCSPSSYFFEFEIPSRNCYLENNPVKYRVYYEIKDIEKDAFVEVKFIYNINQPSEWTSDSENNFVSGDEFNLIVMYDHMDLSYNIPYDRIENRWIKSKRNSVIKFYDLMLPCNGLRLHLKEKD